jgi:hypothetical protein
MTLFQPSKQEVEASLQKAWGIGSGEAAALAAQGPGNIIPIPKDQPYPDNNPKTFWGVNKPSAHGLPPVAILEVGRVMAHGAAKYGLMNWRDQEISISTYYNAALRHLFAMWDGEWVDPESGCPHVAHVMAGMALMLDAKALGKLNDDRPTEGPSAEYIRTNSKAPSNV